MAKTDAERNIELQNAATLKKQLEIEAAAKKALDEKNAKDAAYQEKVNNRLAKIEQSLQQRKHKTKEALAKIEDASKNQARYPVHQHNLASLMMEMEPRLQALGEFYSSMQIQVLREYITTPIARKMVAVDMPDLGIYSGLSRLVNGSKQPDIPDLQYFTEVKEDGSMEAALVQNCIKDFVVQHDEHGNIMRDNAGNALQDEERSRIFQHTFQQGVINWLTDNGFFAHETNGKMRIYPQTLGQMQNGQWTLRPTPALVRERYHDDDCEENAEGVLLPKEGAQPREGQEPLYVTQGAFETMRIDLGLGDYLLNHFEGLQLDAAPSPALRM